jgi:hypothetical protein
MGGLCKKFSGEAKLVFFEIKIIIYSYIELKQTHHT